MCCETPDNFSQLFNFSYCLITLFLVSYLLINYFDLHLQIKSKISSLMTKPIWLTHSLLKIINTSLIYSPPPSEWWNFASTWTLSNNWNFNWSMQILCSTIKFYGQILSGLCKNFIHYYANIEIFNRVILSRCQLWHGNNPCN